jgi:hypothetical protein
MDKYRVDNYVFLMNLNWRRLGKLSVRKILKEKFFVRKITME